MSGQIITAVADVIVRGLRKTSAARLIEEADLTWLDPAEDAVPLGPYRALLAQVLDQCGASAILEAGTELRHATHPILFVLLNSDRPEALVQKEDHLGRYIHSRHGVRIVAAAHGELVLEHYSKTHERAEPTENLASCGQHIALLEMIGADGLTLRFPRSTEPERVLYRDGEVAASTLREGFDLWHFGWDEFMPVRRPMAGLDDLLIDRARLRELDERPGIAAGVERVVRRDLGRTWPLERVARDLGLSKRTLQRRLSDVGRRFSDLVLEVRTDEARRLLRHTDLSVTAIGYVCGFADSSHFNHAFKRRFGASPGSWREAGLSG